MHRRHLLGLLNALLAAALAWPVVSFLAWRPRTEREVVFGPGEQAPMSSRQGVCLVRDHDGLAALDMRCTHLCCIVVLDEDGRVFRCPCHHSVYDHQGRRLEGPAREGLRRLPAEPRPDGSLVVRVPV